MKYLTKYNVMLGSDPELLLKKTKFGITKAFPIVGLLGHGKDNPLYLDDTKFRTLQEDNVALNPKSNKAETFLIPVLQVGEIKNQGDAHEQKIAQEVITQ